MKQLKNCKFAQLHRIDFPKVKTTFSRSEYQFKSSFGSPDGWVWRNNDMLDQELVYPSGLGSPDGPDTHNAEEKREGTFLKIFFEFSLSPLAQRISREPTGEIRNADPRDQQPSQPYAGRVIGGGGGSSFCRIECTPPPTTHQLRACLYKGELNPTELN